MNYGFNFSRPTITREYSQENAQDFVSFEKIHTDIFFEESNKFENFLRFKEANCYFTKFLKKNIL